MKALAVLAIFAVACVALARGEQLGFQSHRNGYSTPSQNRGGGGGDSTHARAPSGGGSVASIVSQALFEQMLLHRNDTSCTAKGFYTYDAFIAAVSVFPGFGTTGSAKTRKRGIAAFLGQTSHETTGGWPTAPDGPSSWGYCFKEETGVTTDYCVQDARWPCAAGKKYYGRGPMQIS